MIKAKEKNPEYIGIYIEINEVNNLECHLKE